MATEPVYTEDSTLTPERCRSMVVALLGLEEDAADADIIAAYDQEMGEQEPAAEEPAPESEPAEEERPKKPFKGSAMTIIVKGGHGGRRY